jgi:hypothetical protein
MIRKGFRSMSLLYLFLLSFRWLTRTGIAMVVQDLALMAAECFFLLFSLVEAALTEEVLRVAAALILVDLEEEISVVVEPVGIFK